MTIDVRTHHEIESKRNIPPPPILHHAPYRPRPLLVTGLMTPSKGPLNFKNGAVSSYPPSVSHLLGNMNSTSIDSSSS
ncbi:hypothetical protein ACFX2J_022176 [Malus domestica]